MSRSIPWETPNGLESSEDRGSAGGHGNQHVRLRFAQVRPSDAASTANTVEAVAVFGSFWPTAPCLDILLCCRFAVDARPHRVGSAQSFSKIHPYSSGRVCYAEAGQRCRRIKPARAYGIRD